MADPISNIPVIQIRNVDTPYIPYWTIRQPYVPNFNPVTNQMGFPIVEMPGCVEMHKDNIDHTSRLPFDKDLVNQDPKGSTVLCPNGQYPTYSAMDYEPEQMTIITEQKAPPVSNQVPDPPESPETPTDTKVPEEKEPECPGPNAPRIGDVAQNQKEKVSGHELQKDPLNPGKQICVVLYEDIGPAEQYLPTPQVAATTAVIATVATGSALLAKPLADLMLRVFRPAIKQAIGRVQKILGKEKKEILSLRERMALQRDRTRAIREFRRMRKFD
jgi:hypothetical protein